MNKHLNKFAIGLTLTLSACSLAPMYQRPAMDVPVGWSGTLGVGSTEQNTTPFWQELGSAELDHLIDNVLAQNLDLEAALQRIDQARALAKVAGSPLYPQANASANAGH